MNCSNLPALALQQGACEQVQWRDNLDKLKCKKYENNPLPTEISTVVWRWKQTLTYFREQEQEVAPSNLCVWFCVVFKTFAFIILFPVTRRGGNECPIQTEFPQTNAAQQWDERLSHSLGYS